MSARSQRNKIPHTTIRPRSSGNLKKKACLLAMPLVLATAQHGLAQSAGARTLEEVVVTASRREEGLQSVPASILAMTGAELDKQGITGFRDMAETVSGLDLKQSRGSVSSAVYIRGVGTSGSTPADPSVGILVDGVYQTSLGAAFTELLDIQRVEVLRGPQGTLFGKNTTAGVIRIFTERPDTHEFSGRVQGVAGNLNNRELRGLVNIPLVEGRLAARLGGYTAERDGHTKNLFVGEDTRNIDRHGWRGKLLWHATDALDIQLTAERHKQKGRMESGVAVYPPALLAQFGHILPPISAGRYQQDAEEIWEDVTRYILHADWELNNHTVSLISSLEKIESFLSQDRDGTVLSAELGSSAITFLTNLAEREVTTHELQLSSSFDGPFNYIVGGFWQNVERVSTTDLILGAGTPRPGVPSEAEYKSQALFGNVSYAFDDRWTVSVGARYSDDEQVGSNNIFSGTRAFDEWTYSFKVQYQMDSDRMLYFAHDKGFKSGGINREFSACGRGGPCLSPAQAFWDPETTLNYEVGIKSEWLDRRLRLNGALFHQIYDDFQVNQTVPGDASVLLTNAAEVESTGVETDFVWVATDKLVLGGNLAYMKTKFKDYQNAPCSLPTIPRCVGGSQDLSGRILDNAPRLSYSVNAEYRDTLALEQSMEWFARLDFSYKGTTYMHEAQAPETKEGSYSLLNGRVGIEFPDRWRVTLWGKNLTDENYLVFSRLAERGLEQIPGLPRTYGLTLDWFF